MMLFRVHTSDGGKHDVEAENADHARKIATARKLGHITKIKIVRSA